VSNGLSPDLLTPTERIAEIGALLAAGLIRLHASQSSQTSAASRDSSLDCAPDQSVHATAPTEMEEGQ
jgi:hypothetical protein